MGVQGGDKPYRNLEIHHLLGERAHLIIETESIFPLLLRGEDKIALPFLGTVQYHLSIRTDHLVVDIEGAA